jgi:hypothetical protein
MLGDREVHKCVSAYQWINGLCASDYNRHLAIAQGNLLQVLWPPAELASAPVGRPGSSACFGAGILHSGPVRIVLLRDRRLLN